MSNAFIGMGKSPDGIDLPLGLSMELALHPHAAATFGKMDRTQKQAAIQYVQSCTSGEDAKRRIRNAIAQMENGHMTIT